MPPSSTLPKFSHILPCGIRFRHLTLSFLVLTVLSFILLLIISPQSLSAQETTALDANSDPGLYTTRFIALLQARPGETRQDVAVRVDRIAMAIAGDVETHLLFAEDPNEDRSTPARYPIDYLFTLKTPETVSLAAHLEAVASTFHLEWIEPDFIAVGAGQRNLQAGYGYLSPQDLRSPGLSGSRQSGQPVTVAVLDTGVDLSNPTLSSRTVEGFNFLTGTANPQDDHGQGTSVAEIISAQDSAEGLEVAPMIHLMPLKILNHANRGFYSDAIRAVRYAVDRGAQAINLGIGGQYESRALREALRYAVERGVVVVSPMMNDGDDSVYYPAAYPEIIAVGAVSRDDQRLSNYGDHIDVVAYGDSILTADLMADYRYSAWWGSSNASAIVSGVVAALKARSPSLSPAQIQEVLQRTARDRIGDPSEDVPGWDPFHGHGLVNAGEAAAAVVGLSGSNRMDNPAKRDASTAATSQRKTLREARLPREQAYKVGDPRSHGRKVDLAQDHTPFKILSNSEGTGVTLVWHAPTTNADGTPLTDLGGVKLYYGLSSRKYTSAIDVGNQTTYTVSSLESGRTYYFAVTAYDTAGNESGFSNEISTTVTTPEFVNLALSATATASSVWSSAYGAAKANDGQGATRWNSAAGDTAGAWLALDFGAPTAFDTVVLKEAINRITGYTLQYWDGASWQDIVAGTSIGASKTHTFAALTAQRIRLHITRTVSSSSSGTPTVVEMEVYD